MDLAFLPRRIFDAVLAYRRNAHCLICLALITSYSCSSVDHSTSTRPTVQIFETTGDRAKLLQPEASVTFESGSGAGLQITINDSTKYQQMDGFGASLTDSAAWVVSHKLSAQQQSDLWQSLFSATNGIGISFLRQPMGASDFTASGNYSYDDVPARQTDPRLRNFSISHDSPYIIPLLQRALAVNTAIKVVAVPWSPPAWMKTSGTMNGGSMNTAYFPSLAQYFVKFVQGYQAQGIPIYAVLPQNEPLNPNTGYPSEYLPANDEAKFIGANLGPALNAAGLGSVKILGYDHNWDTPSYPQSLLADATASSYLAGNAFHCYAGDPSAQTAVKNAYPNRDVWFTECSGITGTSFARDLVWNAENLLIGATRNWARSVSLWNLALDQNSGPKNGGCANCRGVVTVDASTSPAIITNNVEFYALGHIAKFVVPGAYRVDSNTFGSGSIEDVAFQNPDGSMALLVLNAAKGSSAFSVNWRGQTFNYTLPAGAVATFAWKPQ